jgi:hypothetical protein
MRNGGLRSRVYFHVSRIFLVAALAAAAFAQQDPTAIVRRSLEADRKSLELGRQYAYVEFQEQRRVDDAGRVTSRDSKTWDVTLVEGSPYRHLVLVGGKQLTGKDLAKEDQRLRDSITVRRQETEAERQARLADWARRESRLREPLREVPDAFNLRLAGEERIEGRDAWVIEATPRPGYTPRSKASAYLTKVNARLWIDKATYQWIRVTGETQDTISWGGILFRLARGTHVTMEQMRITDDVWLLKRVLVEGNGRLLLVKSIRGAIEFAYSNPHKVQLDARAASVGTSQGAAHTARPDR